MGRFSFAFSLVLTFAGYLAASQVGLLLPFGEGNMSPLWPAAGVSLAAVLLAGPRVWPAIFLADLSGSLLHAFDPWRSLGMAAVNAVEPLLGAWIVQRLASGFDRTLCGLRDTLLLVLAAIASTAIAGLLWAAYLRALAGPRVALLSHWHFWMSGDLVGILIVCPLLLAWNRTGAIPSPARLAELALALAGLAGATQLAFGGMFDPTPSLSLAYLVFPFIIWIALRFGPAVAPLGVVAAAALAIWGLANGAGPYGEGTFGQRTIWTHTFLGTAAVASMVFAALMAQYRASTLALRASEERFRDLFENAIDSIVTFDLEGRVTGANRRCQDATGRSLEELLRMTVFDLVAPGDGPVVREVLAGELATGREATREVTARTPRGQRLEVRARVMVEDGRPIGIHATARDVTQRKELESQLRHAQKMEAVGRLAGGVAHDFNNLLTVIRGYSDLLLESEAGERCRPDVEAIRGAADRAAALTHQLLAFSRRQVLQPKLVNVNDLLHDLEKLLPRLIGEDIDVTFDLSPKLRQTRVDPGQFGQVIMNLAVNARDAMPNGGRLSIRTSNVVVSSEDAARHMEVSPGSYVVTAVADGGMGMDRETVAHIFEPFYTTKPSGQGTGLGLSTVYGIVRQSGGYIDVESTPGTGTVFHVHLPATDEQPQAEAPDRQEPARGSATILVVEDEHAVRQLVETSLRKLGYSVLSAGDGEEAWEVADAYTGRIDLLLTDVVMPGMRGPELLRQLLLRRPRLRWLFMSGYTDSPGVRAGINEDTPFLQKPFTIDRLAEKVTEALTQKAPNRPDIGGPEEGIPPGHA